MKTSVRGRERRGNGCEGEGRCERERVQTRAREAVNARERERVGARERERNVCKINFFAFGKGGALPAMPIRL